MLLRRAATVTGRPLLARCYTQSAVSLAPIEEYPSMLQTLEYLDGFPQPDPKHNETILAIPRSAAGTNVSVKERKAGRVPAIVFEQEDGQNGGNKRLISVWTNQIRKLVNHLGRSFFLSRLFDLEVREAGFVDDGDEGSRVIVEKVRVLPRKAVSKLMERESSLTWCRQLTRSSDEFTSFWLLRRVLRFAAQLLGSASSALGNRGTVECDLLKSPFTCAIKS